MIVLTEKQRDQLEQLNETSPFPGRRLEPIPAKAGQWVLFEDVLADSYWSHWHGLLQELPRQPLTKSDLVDNQFEVGPDGKPRKNIVSHPFVLAMKAEKERIKAARKGIKP